MGVSYYMAELLRLMNEELVLDAREVDWGHDVTLNRTNLALTVAQRMDALRQVLRDLGWTNERMP